MKSATNLEDGIEILANDKRIEFVVLDGKCFVDSDQEFSGSTVENMPHQASRQIDDINRVQNREIRYCVNTGFVDDLGRSFEGIFKVISKGNNTELFEFIKSEVSQTEAYKLKRKYSHAFTPYDLNIIDDSYLHCLTDVLRCLESEDYKKRNLNTIRDVLESIYLTLNKNYACIPDELMNQYGKPNMEWCNRYIEGRPTNDRNGAEHRIGQLVPGYIGRSMRFVKEISSEFSHLSEDDVVRYPFISSAYALLEVLSWLPGFVDENFESQ
jgi:hypothetical protein